MADVAILDIADEQHTTRDLCKIPYPIQEEGSACLGRRKRMAVQNAIAQNKKPKFQSFERLKAPAGGGRQALPGGATGWDMIVGCAHYAEVFCNEFRRQHEQKFAV